MIKRFFAGVWGAITTIRVALANLLFILILVILWEAFVMAKPEPLPDSAALLLDLRGRVVDVQTRVNTSSLLADQSPAGREYLLQDLIDAVTLAAKDSRVSSLVMVLDQLVSIGQSKTSELAEALTLFRESGKPVIAVGDYYTQDQYRLAVEADTILMHPQGVVALEGYSFFTNYYAEALEKLLVSMHVFKAGEFKSIAEPLLRSDMSAGEREITRAWLAEVWQLYTRQVEARRALAEGSVDDLLNNFPSHLAGSGGSGAQLALDEGLVDQIANRSEQQRYLQSVAGKANSKLGYAAVSYDDYLARTRSLAPSDRGSTIAIVSAEGSIIPGKARPGTIGGDELALELAKAAQRKDVKALVLRINSGGGSVFASEIIREQVALIRAEGKPVVVSMGRVAASGGYYIATAADKIVATESTLTGSIGVFAAFPTFERLLAKGGVFTDGVATTAYSGGLRPDRALATDIEAVLQLSVDNTYEQFVDLVAESRDLSVAQVDAVAQGRVLAASAAREAGLVDRIGSLAEAVRVAAEIAGLAEGSYEVLSIQPTFTPQQILLQQLSDSFGKIALLQSPIAAVLGFVEKLEQPLQYLETFDDPQRLYMRCLVCAVGSGGLTF
ncbi:MAG: signal peptide peptidase SppA [Pseudomonadota bacterium]